MPLLCSAGAGEYEQRWFTVELDARPRAEPWRPLVGTSSRRSDDPDVGHHAAVLMFADVAVINEISHFSEGNPDRDRLDRAPPGSPGCHRAIASPAAIGE